MLLNLVCALTVFCFQTPEPLILTVTASSAHYRGGSPIQIEIAVTNTSKSNVPTITAGKNAAEVTYDISVVGSDGKEATLTDYGRKLHGQDSTGLMLRNTKVVFLKPGERTTSIVRLDSVYKLPPGRYVVRVSMMPNTPDVYPHTTIRAKDFDIDVVN